MIDEKHKGAISIVCICLSVIFILSAFFIVPQKKNSITASSNNTQLLNKDKITEINIEIDEEDWNWLLENATQEEYRSANVTINGEKYYNVGLRPKGNSSLSSVARDSNSDRYSLKIDFSEYVKGQTYHGMEKLALNNMMSDATYMKETLSYDLYASLGIPTPGYSYSSIKVNGKDWGLYLGVEVIEENFIVKNYGSLKGNLYKPESMEIGGGMAKGGADLPGAANQGGNRPQMDPQNLPNGAGAENGANRQQQQNKGFGNRSGGGTNLKYTDDNPSSYSALRESAVFKTTTDEDFNKVIEMMKNLNAGTNLEEYLDVEGILKYFAVNTFLVNLDSYSGGMYHNYYLYESDGRFSIIPWDLNMSFAGFSMGRGGGGNAGNSGSISSAQTAVNFPIDNPVTGNLEDAPLIGNLLKVDKYKELYHSYLDKIVDEYVNSGTFENSAAKIDNLIGEYVKTDATAFFTYDQYKNSLPQLIAFGKDRATSVAAQLSGEQPSNTYGNIETTVNLSSLGSMGMGGQRDGAGQMPAGGNAPGNVQMPGAGQVPQDGQFPNMRGKRPNMEGKAAGNGQRNNMGGQMPNFDGQAPSGGQMPQWNNAAVVTKLPWKYIALIASIVLTAAFGLIFIFKFKRKRPVKARASI